MKHIFGAVMAAVLLSGTSLAQAQSAVSTQPVYTVVEQMPRFKSADSSAVAMVDYLMRTTRYPVSALIDKATGRVFVGFVVNEEGKVEQVKLVKGRNRALDNEALRVVSEMPRWEVPGRQQGKPVKVAFTVPITFNMSTATPAQARAIMAAQSQRRADVLKQLNDAQSRLGTADAPGRGSDTSPVFTADPLGAANYISRNVQYPIDAQRAKQQG